ncbi:MAG: ABC transporter permease subunit [Flavobacteriales bacterium]|nr:ABC transporter permease subunit [Flavobacteriales bacterium]
MWKVSKYTLLDLARNRFALGYALLLLAVSAGMFMLEGDNTKALIGLSQIVLALTPLLALVFTIIYFYNQYEFTVLLAVQPLRRRSIVLGQAIAVAIALLVSFLFGIGLPVIAWAPGPVGWTLLLTGAALTTVFCALGAWIAVKQRDRARAVGLGLAAWVIMVLVYDSLLLWIMFSFSDRPIEPVIVPLAALNPIDLSRILIMLKIDLAALLGYTGAVYQKFFGGAGGMLVSFVALLLWMVLPAWGAVRTFARKDL